MQQFIALLHTSKLLALASLDFLFFIPFINFWSKIHLFSKYLHTTCAVEKPQIYIF